MADADRAANAELVHKIADIRHQLIPMCNRTAFGPAMAAQIDREHMTLREMFDNRVKHARVEAGRVGEYHRRFVIVGISAPFEMGKLDLVDPDIAGDWFHGLKVPDWRRDDLFDVGRHRAFVSLFLRQNRLEREEVRLRYGEERRLSYMVGSIDPLRCFARLTHADRLNCGEPIARHSFGSAG